MNAMIEGYVAEALAGTPENQRADMRLEIRGAIDEMVERRVEAGDQWDDAIRAALNELGDPARLAARYQDRPQYLIGPAWYPTYINALKLVASVVLPIVAVISVLETLADDSGGVGAAIEGAVESVIWAAGMGFFWVTIGFVIAERVEGPEGLGRGSATWTVDDLPTRPATRQFTLRDIVPTVITLIVFGGLVVVQYVRGVGAFVRSGLDESTELLPLFNPDPGAIWVGGFFALLALSLAVVIVRYLVGSWTRPMLLLAVVEAGCWIAFSIALAVSEPIFNPEFARQIDGGDAGWWVAGGSANAAVAVAVIAVSLWDVWDAWQGHRQYRLLRQAAG